MNWDWETVRSRITDYRHQELPHRDFTQAAVLIPILMDPDPHLIYTQRAQHLKHHQGQVSFPGGRVDGQETPLQAAVREAHEEIGLEADQIEIIGRIDDVYSPLGYHIHCYVGQIIDWHEKLNLDEVESVLRVPFAQLFDHANHETKPWYRNEEINVHYYHFSQGTVWGVTGWMTRILGLVASGESMGNEGYRF